MNDGIIKFNGFACELSHPLNCAITVLHVICRSNLAYLIFYNIYLAWLSSHKFHGNKQKN